MIQTTNPFRYRYGRDIFAKWTLPTWFDAGTHKNTPADWIHETFFDGATSGTVVNPFCFYDIPTGATETQVARRSFSRVPGITAVRTQFDAIVSSLTTAGTAFNLVTKSISSTTQGGTRLYSGNFTAFNVTYNTAFAPIFIDYNGLHHAYSISGSMTHLNLVNTAAYNDVNCWSPSFKIAKIGTNDARIFTPTVGTYTTGDVALKRPHFCTVFVQPGTYRITKICDVLDAVSRDESRARWRRVTNTKTITIQSTAGAYYLDLTDDENIVTNNWIYLD